MDSPRMTVAPRSARYLPVTGAARTDAEGFVFPETEQGIVVNEYFTRKDFGWKYTGVDSLKNVKVGIIKGYEYEDLLDAYFAENINTKAVYAASGENSLEDLIEKLLNGDIDIVIEDRQVFGYFFISTGLIEMLENCETAGPTGEPDQLYIAFSPAHPKSNLYAQTQRSAPAQI